MACIKTNAKKHLWLCSLEQSAFYIAFQPAKSNYSPPNGIFGTSYPSERHCTDDQVMLCSGYSGAMI